jgi:hypothetical protein
MFKIIGYNNGEVTTLDEVYDYEEADIIKEEFKNIYGNNWDIEIEGV